MSGFSVNLFYQHSAYAVRTKVSLKQAFRWVRDFLSAEARFCLSFVAVSGPTIRTSTYGLEPVLCNRLLIEPSGWAQTVHMFSQRFT